ncbi:protein phosphatase 1 regulatory subunit 1C isoform X4 [Macaca nemestrina]|uniref:protein phosphatase 1 regulatory subunit 1C isoform X4 n=1 Tax=Macaca nemestrina TaxID=9545 RepID=UPI0039B8411B
MEPNSPKKIQFAVPLFQSQIAPEAAEQIRKRRPTPASLVILNEHNPPETRSHYVTRLVLNSCAQAILPPLPLKVLWLQVMSHCSLPEI